MSATTEGEPAMKDADDHTARRAKVDVNVRFELNGRLYASGAVTWDMAKESRVHFEARYLAAAERLLDEAILREIEYAAQFDDAPDTPEWRENLAYLRQMRGDDEPSP